MFFFKTWSDRRLGRIQKKSAPQDVDTTINTLKTNDVSSTTSASSSSRSLTESFPSELPAEVERLCKKNRFRKAIKLVEQSSLRDWVKVEDGDEPLPQQNWPINTPTPLHLMIQHNRITLENVEAMLRILKDRFHVLIPEEFPDAEGKTPLHYAVEVGCSEDIVKRLLEGESLLMPALWRDSKFQRTPLHWACQPIEGLKGRHKSLAEFYQKMAAYRLLDTYPEAVLIEDSEGKTPLDYAREHKKQSTATIERKIKFLQGSDSVEEPENNQSNFFVPSNASKEVLPDDLSTIVDVLDTFDM